MFYILGLDVLHDHISHCTFSEKYIHIIFYYIFHFSISSTHYSFVFLNHVVFPIHLRLHLTQEVPLPPFICNRSCHIEGNVDFGWGRVKEGSFVNNARLTC